MRRMASTAEGGVSGRRVALAWGVHAFTASGAVVGAAALLAIVTGDLSRAVLLMLLALAIDSVDGWLARAVQVDRAVPRFDGRRLDDMVDFLNYVVVAAVFMMAAESLVHWAWAAVPIIASAYGFSQTEAKTEDDFFLGFPSYWNVIAIYLWLLAIPPLMGTAIVLFFSALVFVPFKYVYPSRMPVLRRTTGVLSLVCALLLAASVLDPERARSLRLVEISLGFPVYYLVLSLWLGGPHRSSPGRGGAED
jgi:phosphatidylcholine synthase